MIYTTQTFYEESFSWCLAHSWGYKAIISLLSCIWNSPQPLCLQKKESETKQARKKKKKESTVYCRNSGNIESSKKDWENYLIINFKCQEWESWVLSSTFYLLVALLQLTGEDRKAASPHEWVFEDEVWPFTALQLPGAAGHSCRGNTALIQAPEVMCQGQWKRKVV